MICINGIVWDICFVDSGDPILYDSYNNQMSVATTDLFTHTIYIDRTVDDYFLLKIIKHELYHCYEFSRATYDLPVLYEECVADFVATHGEDLIDIAYDVWNDVRKIK